MIVSRVWGGLGNQMFQLSAAFALSMEVGDDLYVDTSWYNGRVANGETVRTLDLSNFNINLNHANIHQINSTRYPHKYFSYFREIFDKKLLRRYYTDWDPGFSKNYQTDLYLNGYFQSELYFKKYKSEIMDIFRPGKALEPHYGDALKIFDSLKCPASIHIRRGDYITNSRAAKYHNICDVNYYYSALDLIRSYKEVSDIVIFTDDPDWVRNNIRFDVNTIFASDLHFNVSRSQRNTLEMLMMSICSNHVISNSTYGWWGAYLNRDTNKIVVAPSLWNRNIRFKHNTILPCDWHTVDVY